MGERKIKSRTDGKACPKKAEKICPKGSDPINFLLDEKKCMEKETKPENPLLNVPTPVPRSGGSPGFVPYTFNDLGFSSLADQIKMCYNMGVGPNTQAEPSPSPSSLLFFQNPSFR
mmetsp:Transcript_3822/g.3618  ORF Transcript_3822/g.3618 Transcript_3822/m.3618 type:complete len:116 (+) Transcript_3822:438-785(+)